MLQPSAHLQLEAACAVWAPHAWEALQRLLLSSLQVALGLPEPCVVQPFPCQPARQGCCRMRHLPEPSSLPAHNCRLIAG